MKRKEPTAGILRKKDDIEFEIAFYESILTNAPNFIEALSAIGDLYTRVGYWQKGLDVDLKLSRLRPQDPVVRYNLACSYALLNQIHLSLSALSKAVELGYDDFAHLKKDADLENLLKDQHVRAFIRGLEKRKKLLA